MAHQYLTSVRSSNWLLSVLLWLFVLLHSSWCQETKTCYNSTQCPIGYFCRTLQGSTHGQCYTCKTCDNPARGGKLPCWHEQNCRQARDLESKTGNYDEGLVVVNGSSIQDVTTDRSQTAVSTIAILVTSLALVLIIVIVVLVISILVKCIHKARAKWLKKGQQETQHVTVPIQETYNGSQSERASLVTSPQQSTDTIV